MLIRSPGPNVLPKAGLVHWTEVEDAEEDVGLPESVGSDDAELEVRTWLASNTRVTTRVVWLMA